MNSFILFLAVFAASYGAILPDYITQCSKSDPKLSECLQKSVSRAWPTIVKGDTTYHIQPLNPLKVPFLQINVANIMHANLTNGQFHGLENIEIKDVKWDFTSRRIETNFVVPQMKMIGDYGVKGRFLGLPLVGNGVCDISFDNMDCKHSFEYNLVERNGKQYIDIKQTRMSYTLTNLHVYLGNLFNGNNLLGKAMNDVMNENWEAANAESNPYFGNAVGELYSHVLQNFFNKVSLNEIFSN